MRVEAERIGLGRLEVSAYFDYEGLDLSGFRLDKISDLGLRVYGLGFRV